jgi:hypothetical protein
MPSECILSAFICHQITGYRNKYESREKEKEKKYKEYRITNMQILHMCV